MAGICLAACNRHMRGNLIYTFVVLATVLVSGPAWANLPTVFRAAETVHSGVAAVTGAISTGGVGIARATALELAGTYSCVPGSLELALDFGAIPSMDATQAIQASLAGMPPDVIGRFEEACGTPLRENEAEEVAMAIRRYGRSLLKSPELGERVSQKDQETLKVILDLPGKDVDGAMDLLMADLSRSAFRWIQMMTSYGQRPYTMQLVNQIHSIGEISHPDKIGREQQVKLISEVAIRMRSALFRYVDGTQHVKAVDGVVLFNPSRGLLFYPTEFEEINSSAIAVRRALGQLLKSENPESGVLDFPVHRSLLWADTVRDSDRVLRQSEYFLSTYQEMEQASLITMGISEPGQLVEAKVVKKWKPDALIRRSNSEAKFVVKAGPVEAKYAQEFLMKHVGGRRLTSVSGQELGDRRNAVIYSFLSDQGEATHLAIVRPERGMSGVIIDSIPRPSHRFNLHRMLEKGVSYHLDGDSRVIEAVVTEDESLVLFLGSGRSRIGVAPLYEDMAAELWVIKPW